jgi:IS5 family transposase
VPDDPTLLRWAQLLGPHPLQRGKDRGRALARTLKVTRGRQLRVDSPVGATTIHQPTERGLLCDGGRVLSRLRRRAKAVVGQGVKLGKAGFRTRPRSARRVAPPLHRRARRKGEEAVAHVRHAYERLLTIGHRSQHHARRVCGVLRSRGEENARRLVQRLEQFVPRVAQVVSPTTRRVLQGTAVPASAKLVSGFEPHTQMLQRPKPGKAVEFGRKLWLDEGEGGLISRYARFPSAGADAPSLADSFAGHKERFGRAPWLVAGARGVATPDTEALAKKEGGNRVVLPQKGNLSAQRRRYEPQRWFRRGFRFRAGGEGRLSVLRRRFGLGRCLEQGEAGLGRWVGWGIVTAHLAKIAKTQAGRRAA